MKHIIHGEPGPEKSPGEQEAMPEMTSLVEQEKGAYPVHANPILASSAHTIFRGVCLDEPSKG